MLTPAVTVMKTLKANFLGTFLLSRSREDHRPEQIRTNHRHRLDARPPYVAGAAAYTASKRGNGLFARVRQGGCGPRNDPAISCAGSYFDRPFGFCTREILAGRTSANAIAEMGNLTDVSNAIDGSFVRKVPPSPASHLPRRRLMSTIRNANAGDAAAIEDFLLSVPESGARCMRWISARSGNGSTRVTANRLTDLIAKTPGSGHLALPTSSPTVSRSRAKRLRLRWRACWRSTARIASRRFSST